MFFNVSVNAKPVIADAINVPLYTINNPTIPPIIDRNTASNKNSNIIK